MRTLIGALIFIVIGCGSAWSQIPTGAEARLKEKNIQLPSPSTPVANYVGAVRTGNLLFLAGERSWSRVVGEGESGQGRNARGGISGGAFDRIEPARDNAAGPW